MTAKLEILRNMLNHIVSLFMPGHQFFKDALP